VETENIIYEHRVGDLAISVKHAKNDLIEVSQMTFHEDCGSYPVVKTLATSPSDFIPEGMNEDTPADMFFEKLSENFFAILQKQEQQEKNEVRTLERQQILNLKNLLNGSRTPLVAKGSSA